MGELGLYVPYPRRNSTHHKGNIFYRDIRGLVYKNNNKEKKGKGKMKK